APSVDCERHRRRPHPERVLRDLAGHARSLGHAHRRGRRADRGMGRPGTYAGAVLVNPVNEEKLMTELADRSTGSHALQWVTRFNEDFNDVADALADL